jgi:crotonobetainyl-CoA:carnitine CoA-transferase CaiB-like acyl-CoA transferase
MTAACNLPLAGIRILAVEQYGAGPFGTQHLADLGAQVIKIENPADGGDMSRGVGPHFVGPRDSHFFESFNRNKESLTLNLKTPEGQSVLHRLVGESHAVFNNLRGDLPEALGLTYAQLAVHNPAVVCVHLSAYGRTGSRAAWPGYDYLMQAQAGYLSLTGEPDGPPARMGLSLVDLMTGTTAALALVSGLLSALRSGQGRDWDVSLFDVAMHNLAYVATWQLNANATTQREPRSSHPSLTPSQLYRTQDGWLLVMCNKDKFWPLFAQGIGHPEWVDDPDFATYEQRLKHREALTQRIDAALMTQPTDHWLACLQDTVPIAPVHDVAQALSHPFVEERGLVLNFDHPQGPLRMVASPIRVDSPHPTQAAPALGQHTESILRAAGIDDATIQTLRDLRII